MLDAVMDLFTTRFVLLEVIVTLSIIIYSGIKNHPIRVLNSDFVDPIDQNKSVDEFDDGLNARST